MVGTHAKGKSIEKAFAAHLTQEGIARVCWVPPMGKYASNDIFGLFDLVYIKPYDDCVVFVQICHPNSVIRHKKAIDNWFTIVDRPYADFELWTYTKDGRFRKVKEW